MPANKRLYDYLSQHAEEISSTWFQNIDENDPTPSTHRQILLLLRILKDKI